jgi:hypothetical protein
LANSTSFGVQGVQGVIRIAHQATQVKEYKTIVFLLWTYVEDFTIVLYSLSDDRSGTTCTPFTPLKY